MGKVGYQGNPEVLRFPRLEKPARAAMVEDWNADMYSKFPTYEQLRISIGKRLIQIKWLQGHGKFRRWFDAQHFQFDIRSAQNYMSEAKEYYTNPNTNNSSYSPVPRMDGVHRATAKKKAEFARSTFSLTIYGLSPKEIQRLRDLRKTEDRAKLNAVVIKSLQPFLKGKRVATHPA